MQRHLYVILPLLHHQLILNNNFYYFSYDDISFSSDFNFFEEVVMAPTEPPPTTALQKYFNCVAIKCDSFHLTSKYCHYIKAIKNHKTKYIFWQNKYTAMKANNNKLLK